MELVFDRGTLLLYSNVLAQILHMHLTPVNELDTWRRGVSKKLPGVG